MTTTTRSSANNHDSSPNSQDPEVGAGTKHSRTEGAKSPEPKKARTTEPEEGQKTIEETLSGRRTKTSEDSQDQHQSDRDNQKDSNKDQENKDKAAAEGEEDSSNVEQGQPATAEQNRSDPEAIPSSILEKGIIYFFFRGRVGIDEPSDVSDIARSYIVLRPLDKDAKLGSGPIGDAGNSRVCVIPKKVLPQTGRDRWISFVEKTGASFQTLKDEFLASSDYETKTAGTRHSPAATPIGEGVYAITSTGRESHLVYMLTLPDKLGEVQKEMGLKDKGSFVISTKNPQYSGPANTRLPKGPEYPKEVLDEFRSLRWIATQPKHLDYVNTQFLLVGESSGVKKALEPQKKDQEEGKEEPADEMEKLEEEDAKRMQDLSSSDAGRIYADLQVRAAEYPKLQTTF